MKKNKAVVLGIALGVLFGLSVKLFVFDFLTVRGSSMSPTINDGEIVFVNRLAYGIAVPFRGTFIVQWASPKTDDIVIYLHDDRIVVKRCAAVGGTTLEFSEDSDYNLLLGGNKIKLSRTEYEKMKNYERVPEGYILALGDNYPESVDSRTYGFVSVKNITGKIIGR